MGWALHYKVDNVIGVIKSVVWSDLILMRGFTFMYKEPKFLIGALLIIQLPSRPFRCDVNDWTWTQ